MFYINNLKHQHQEIIETNELGMNLLLYLLNKHD